MVASRRPGCGTDRGFPKSIGPRPRNSRPGDLRPGDLNPSDLNPSEFVPTGVSMSPKANTRDTHPDKTRLERFALPHRDPEALVLGTVLALTAQGDFDGLTSYLDRILEAGAPPGEAVLEILLEAHLFAGFPRAIQALTLLKELRAGRGLPALKTRFRSRGHRPSRRGGVRSRRRKGLGLFRKIYKKSTPAVLKSLHSLHPHYDRWVLEDAYGRVLARPHLSGTIRELCAVAALTVTGGPRQLRSHIGGALRLGARRSEVEAVIKSVAPLGPDKKIRDALEILKSLHVE